MRGYLQQMPTEANQSKGIVTKDNPTDDVRTYMQLPQGQCNGMMSRAVAFTNTPRGENLDSINSKYFDDNEPRFSDTSYGVTRLIAAVPRKSDPSPSKASLPTGAAERKNVPIYSGVLKYFPDAIAYIAKISKAGNDQHNPGQPLHWSREKSGDHHDCAARHLLESGTVDTTDGLLHSGKLAWRALALLQLEIEAEKKD